LATSKQLGIAMPEIRDSRPSDAADLLRIWRQAVDSSHDFLAPEDRAAIDPLVADYVATAPLQVACIDGVAVGFMGVNGQKIDSLFIDPRVQGQGVGRMLTERVPLPAEVDVNEQNAKAVAFYRQLGFAVTGRSPLDDQGRPYPLLHLRKA
jgi:putative acetyltransferase